MAPGEAREHAPARVCVLRMVTHTSNACKNTNKFAASSGVFPHFAAIMEAFKGVPSNFKCHYGHVGKISGRYNPGSLSATPRKKV